MTTRACRRFDPPVPVRLELPGSIRAQAKHHQRHGWGTDDSVMVLGRAVSPDLVLSNDGQLGIVVSVVLVDNPEYDEVHILFKNDSRIYPRRWCRLLPIMGESFNPIHIQSHQEVSDYIDRIEAALKETT